MYTMDLKFMFIFKKLYSDYESKALKVKKDSLFSSMQLCGKMKKSGE